MDAAPVHLSAAWVADTGLGRLHGADAVSFRGAAIDSRRVSKQMLFACLPGEHVDGHDYAQAAIDQGAACLLVSRELTVSVPQIIADDVVAMLAAIATFFRESYEGASWLAVTGSNGKTTVKELLAAACAPLGQVHATAGNYNNHLGVPLSVLATPPDCSTVIIEIGANHQGEIRELVKIVQPAVGVITGIGPAHLDGFGGLSGVAAGKSEIFGGVQSDGHCLFCRYGLDAYCQEHDLDVVALLDVVRTAAGNKRLTVVGDVGCPIDGELGVGSITLQTPVGSVALQLSGEHNLANACLAWHAAVAAGTDPKKALTSLAAIRPAPGRLQLRRLGDHRLYDDSYNANPASMKAGLAVLAREPGARLAVLGGMGELGADSEALHREVGAAAAAHGLPLVTVGDAAAAIAAGYEAASGRDLVQVTDTDAAVAELLRRLQDRPMAVLVKASRAAGLDKVVAGVMEALGYGNGTSEEAATC